MKTQNKKTIRVCYVSTIDFAIRFLLFNHIKNLQQSGYDVSVVCAPGKWIKEIEENGILVKPIAMKRIINPFSDMVALLKLIFYFHREKFDIVHTSTPKAGLLGTLAAKIVGVPIIIHSNLGFYFEKSSHWIKRKFFLLIERITAKCSNLVFSVDRADIKTAIKEKVCPPKKIKYLGGWVDLNRFNPYKFSKEFIQKKKKELGIPQGVKVIGIVARLVKDKGYYELFDAFSKVLKKFPDTILLIVGPEEPEKKDRISFSVVKKYNIEKNILFLGERTDVNEIYSVMDVFVLPSYREGVAVSVLEALAMEISVIATKVGGVPESVDDGKTGILIPPKNVEKLTEAIISLFNNPEKAKEMGRAGRKKIEREFNERIVFDRIKKEYQRLIGKRLKLKKIKVCHISSVELTIRFILLNTLKFLKNQGYDISVVCSPGKWIQNIKKDGIKVKTIRLKRKFSPFSDLIAFIKFYFYFKREKFDIVHTHTLKPEFLGQIAAKLARVPIIINTNHGFDFGEDASFLKRKFFIYFKKITTYHSDIIFSVSRLIINTAIKERICSSALLKYQGEGVSISRFNPKRFSQDFILKKRKQLGIKPNNKVIGIVARLVEEKGYLELFKAFRAVLDEFPDTLLLIVGPKEPEKKDAIDPRVVKKYNIEKNVIFLGKRADVDELYPLMDIFVLPTHREGLGLVILEASAMEKPVIVTNTGGCPEIVDDGKTGILIPLKNVEKLTEAIIYLLSNPDKAKEMGKAGRKKIEQEFDERMVFDRIKKEYQRIIKEKLK